MLCQCKLWLFSISLVSCVLFVAAFNVDYVNHAYFRGKTDSMFGFTVAIHKSRNRGWLLVGAPEDQSAYHPSLNRSGVVYKCDVTREEVCEEVNFDQSQGNNIATDRQEIDDKSGQWFGATLTATGTEEGRVVACAPRYVWFTEKNNRRDPVGTCWVTDGLFREFNEYSPCRARNRWGYHRQGSCQAGFSAALDSQGDFLFMGAPGSWYWQGEVYSINASEHLPFTPGWFHTFGWIPGSYDQGGAHSQSLGRRALVFSTPVGSATDDDSYMGYSTVVGKFANDEKESVAVGMPRGNQLSGRVLLFTWNITNFKNFTGDQIGSYFGYALAAADVDGDGKDDLIIGAPMFAPKDAKDKYDVGRVYVIYQKNNFENEEDRHIIDGFQSKSRFGQALVSLKDINLDGYEDFAVGAPYGGPNEEGAVYIYHGSANGVRKNYSQVIFAKDVEIFHRYPIKTFGFSLSGGMDLDGNGYPDMAVGAYDSHSAFFFRSRPVVKVAAMVEYLHESKQIDINQKDCRNEMNEEVICTSIQFCLHYSGLGIDDSLTFILKYTVDAKKNYNPRMAFTGSNTNTFSDRVSMRKEEERCFKYDAYIKNEFTDKLTPLDVEVEYNLEDAISPQALPLVRDPNTRKLTPIIDHDLPLSRKDSLIIFKNCPDNKCIPNLQVEASSTVFEYLLGSPDDLKIGIYIRNFGQDSFETTLEVKHPEAFQFVGKDDKTVSTPVRCTPFNRTVVKCDIGNPLPAENVADFYMRFSEQKEATIGKMLDFEFIVNSTNPEDNSTLDDNHAYLSVGVMVNANLDIWGESYPKSIVYNFEEELPEKIMTASDVGPPVTYVYYLTNFGPSPVYESEVFFVWPYETLDGEDLLYLTQQPQVLGNAQCDKVPVDKNDYHFAEFRYKNEFEKLNINKSDLNIAQVHEANKTGLSVESGKGFSGVAGGTYVNDTVSENGEVTGDSSFDILRRHNYSESEAKKREDILQEYTYVTRIVRDPELGDVPIVTMYNHLGIIDEFRVETGNSFEDETHSQTLVGSRKKVNGGGSVQVEDKGDYTPGIEKHTYSSSTQWSKGDGNGSYYSTSKQQSSSSGGTRYQESHSERSGGQQFTSAGAAGDQGISSTYNRGGHGQGQGGYQKVYTTYYQGGSSGAAHKTLGSQQGTSAIQHSQGSVGTHQGSGGGNQQGTFSTHHQESSFSNLQGSGGGLGQQQGTVSTYRGESSSSRQGSGGASGNRGTVSTYYREGSSNLQGSGGESRNQGTFSTYQGVGSTGYQGSGGASGNRGTVSTYYREGSSNHQGSGGESRNHGEGSSGRQGSASISGQQQGSFSTYNRESSSSSERRGQGGISSTYHRQGSQQGSVEGASGNYGYTRTRTQVLPTTVTRGKATESVSRTSNVNADGGTTITETRTIVRPLTITGGNVTRTVVTSGNVYGSQDGNLEGFGQQGYRGGASGSSSSYYQQAGNNEAIYNDPRRVYDKHLSSQLNNMIRVPEGSLKTTAIEIDPGYQIHVTEGNLQNYDEYGGFQAHGRRSSEGREIHGGRSSEGRRGSSTSSGHFERSEHETRSSGRDSDGRRQEWHQERQWTRSGSVPAAYDNSVERDNVPTEEPEYIKFRRGKRQVPKPENAYRKINEELPCKASRCFYMRCLVGEMEQDEQVVFALSGRVNKNTLRKISINQPITLSTMMSAKITRLPYIDREIITHELRLAEVTTTILPPSPELKSKVVPLWIVVLSAIAGTLILLLLILLLYKLGFFKRNRPSNAPERQPLNRNGYHHGDEAL